MPGVTLTLELDDLAPRAALARAVSGAEDMTELMDQIGTVLVNGAVERIAETNVGPDGTPWQQSHRAAKTGGKTLHDSGMLMRSINAHAAPRQVAVGSNLPYAGAHQEGMEIEMPERQATLYRLKDEDGRVGNRFVSAASSNVQQEVTISAHTLKLPARPYLGVSNEEAADIEELSLIYFSGFLDGEAR